MKKGRIVHIIAFGVFATGALLSIGGIVSVTLSIDPSVRTVSVEAEFSGWLLMIGGIGVILLTDSIRKHGKHWPSLLSYSVHFVGLLIGLGVLLVPKVMKVPLRYYDVLYNSVLPSAFWMSILGLGLLVWIFKTKETDS